MPPPEVNKERRSKKRFSIERDVRYKLLNGHHISATGAGKTLDMSSTGIAFTTQQPLPLGTLVELSISWPALLNNDCPMKLMVFGRIIRSEAECAATTIERYEFRTTGRGGLTQGQAASISGLRL